MYATISDPYCYDGTTILKNILSFREQTALDAFEAASTTQRSDEPLPKGLLSVRHYCAIHRHLFQDVYVWAGHFRSVRLSKQGSMFCYPEHIAREMRKLFGALRSQRYLRGLSRSRFTVEVARFLASINAIHPFREGNGRTQMTFVTVLAAQSGHPLALAKLNPDQFLAAMIASFRGRERSLVAQFEILTA